MTRFSNARRQEEGQKRTARVNDHYRGPGAFVGPEAHLKLFRPDRFGFELDEV
jgi:hypothetical protein